MFEKGDIVMRVGRHNNAIDVRIGDFLEVVDWDKRNNLVKNLRTGRKHHCYQYLAVPTTNLHKILYGVPERHGVES